MEIEGVDDVFDFSWLEILSQMSEVFLGVFGFILSLESVFLGVLKTSFIFSVNSLSGCFSK
jgi:hypothetical protein